MRRLGSVTLGLVLSLLVLTSAAAQVAPQPAPEAVFFGSVPTRGGVALVAVTGETPVAVLLDALRDEGCEPELLAVTIGGRFRLYSPDAPAFANREFPDPLVPPRAAIVSCSPASQVRDAHLVQLVTKDHALPADFVPEDLVALPEQWTLPGLGSERLTAEAAAALEEMLQAASDAGHEIVVRSAYRSYEEQVYTYQYWVDILGATEADRRSARPGHSEHQLGTVVDLTNAEVGWDLLPEFGDTPGGQWLKEHAAEYGFVESYPEGAEAITGYLYEPWHLRYVGTYHASLLEFTGLTLTEYLEQLQSSSN